MVEIVDPEDVAKARFRSPLGAEPGVESGGAGVEAQESLAEAGTESVELTAEQEARIALGQDIYEHALSTARAKQEPTRIAEGKIEEREVMESHRVAELNGERWEVRMTDRPGGYSDIIIMHDKKDEEGRLVNIDRIGAYKNGGQKLGPFINDNGPITDAEELTFLLGVVDEVNRSGTDVVRGSASGQAVS